jgi:glutaminase
VIFDLRRVTAMTRAGARLLAEEFRELAAYHVTVILSGIKRFVAGLEDDRGMDRRSHQQSATTICSMPRSNGGRPGGVSPRRRDRLLRGDRTFRTVAADGLTDEELTDLASLASIRTYQASEKIIAAGDPATSLFFLRSGVVHVTLPDGIRLATLTAGMPFGEMALLEPRRSADVLADMAATAYEIPLRDFERFPKAASARRRADHAQPRAIAGRSPDPRQRQGEPADVELGSVGPHGSRRTALPCSSP